MDININDPKFFALNCRLIPTGQNMTYENYLIEVINGSLNCFAQRKTLFEQFHLQKNQSNGEDDAFSSLYSIDFKLLVNQSYMTAMAKGRPSVDASHINQGFIFVHETEKKILVPNSNILFDLMRFKTLCELEAAEDESIVNIMNFLKKNKNLFIYYPHEFSSEADLPVKVGERILNETLRVVMEFREKVQPGKDTFLCFKANAFFLIYEWTKTGFLYRDHVHESLCANYLGAKTYSVY